ncbi:DUF1214 domain-containing protein [Mycobacterium intracellulare]|uniref:DUF1214 domain-containing protein n=1 Tax=Mycobacterium intracellulare TaxID=1767 RepID=UPI001EEE7E8A|nr:DUF1214 domain-containing protein [Mycobacterium intracellulare]MEE3754960.1 DUF1214 domain-containing protein [Mycobacterium intracellulare]
MTIPEIDTADDPRIAHGELWQAFTEAVANLSTFVYQNDKVDGPLLRAEGIRYLTRLMQSAIMMTVEGWDFDYPWLIKFISPYMQYGIPATDCCYHTAAVHGDGVYRIYGSRGSARLFDVETRSGHTAHLAQWTVVDRKSEFDVADDGTIEIVLSATEQPGNWVRIAEGPGSIILRQYYCDWDTEEPADLVIEKDGVAYPPPPLRSAESADRLQLLIDWIRNVPAACKLAVDEYFTAPADTLKFVGIEFAWADLVYGKGIYRCRPDEAVIIEVTPPNAAYWQYQLTSHFWEALDWNLRQTSLNGHQAVLDDDGVFRAVIAHQDPGYANWLDAGGHTVGLITARYYKADSVPLPTIRTVPLASLAEELPASTKTVSAAERQESIRRRARSVWRRRV